VCYFDLSLEASSSKLNSKLLFTSGDILKTDIQDGEPLNSLFTCTDLKDCLSPLSVPHLTTVLNDLVSVEGFLSVDGQMEVVEARQTDSLCVGLVLAVVYSDDILTLDADSLASTFGEFLEELDLRLVGAVGELRLSNCLREVSIFIADGS